MTLKGICQLLRGANLPAFAFVIQLIIQGRRLSRPSARAPPLSGRDDRGNGLACRSIIEVINVSCLPTEGREGRLVLLPNKYPLVSQGTTLHETPLSSLPAPPLL